MAISLFLLQLSFACNPAFYFNMEKKLWRRISFCSTCFCYYKKYEKTIIRFTCYHLLLSSNSTFMTKSLNLGTIQIWRDELMDTAIKSVICQIANCSPFHSIHTSPLICTPNQETGFYMITASVLKRLKLIYYGLISNFSKYYFKTGAICSFSYLHMYLPF